MRDSCCFASGWWHVPHALMTVGSVMGMPSSGFATGAPADWLPLACGTVGGSTAPIEAPLTNAVSQSSRDDWDESWDQPHGHSLQRWFVTMVSSQFVKWFVQTVHRGGSSRTTRRERSRLEHPSRTPLRSLVPNACCTTLRDVHESVPSSRARNPDADNELRSGRLAGRERRLPVLDGLPPHDEFAATWQALVVSRCQTGAASRRLSHRSRPRPCVRSCPAT